MNSVFKWVYIEYQFSTLNTTFTHFHFSIKCWTVLWPQNGEIGERTVSAELGE